MHQQQLYNKQEYNSDASSGVGLKMPLKFLIFGILFFFALTLSFTVHAQNKAELWEKWLASDDSNAEFLVHDPWDFFLKRFVVISVDNGINYLDIDGIGTAEKEEIQAYIDYLASVRITKQSRHEQLPYWINLYNALVIKLLADNPNVKSIKDINLSGGLFRKSDVFSEKLVAVEGEKLSLNDIYHRILRPIWRDPQIHFSLYQGSLGSPNLQHDAYTSENIEFLLFRGASHYINHPRGVFIDDKDKLTLSSIFDWYKQDFGESEKQRLVYLEKFTDEPLQQKLNRINSVSSYSYNWTVNKWIPRKQMGKK